MPDRSEFSSGAYLVRDVLDEQIRARDQRRMGRVAEVRLELAADGTLRATHLLLGVEAHTGRLSHDVARFLNRFLHGRFERRVSVDEIDELGPTISLRDNSDQYDLDSGDRWVARNVLRFIPGNGRRAE